MDTILKNKGPATGDQTLFRLQKKFGKIYLLVMYCLIKHDDVMKSSVWVILKSTSANLCNPVNDIINHPLSFTLLNVENMEKGKIKKKWISRGRKELLKWNKKTFFIVFEWPYKISYTVTWSTPFFYKQSIFDPRPENCLSFSKKSPQKIV